MHIHLLKALILLSSIIILSSCAPRVIKTSPAKVRGPVPSKQLPLKAKIPPTQKPYRVLGKSYYPIPSAYGFRQTGTASWYGKKFHGRKTSTGETYNMYGPTAAHKTLPMNTHLLVKNLENGRETIVRVNDRGPFVKGRIIDLSLTAAREVDMDKKGTAKVRITALGEAVTTSRGGKRMERFLPYQNFRAGEFFVQIGSFTQKDNADRLKAKMLGQGMKTVTQVYPAGSAIFYRVQVRAGRTLDAAAVMEGRLESTYPGAFVIAH